MILDTNGYQDWSCLLMASIEPGGQYQLFLKEMQQLMNEIREYNGLIGEQASNTDTFLHDTFPRAVANVLELHSLSSSETKTVIEFLYAAVDVVAWSIRNGRSAGFDYVLKMFDSKSLFYGNRNPATWSETIHTAVWNRFQEKCDTLLTEQIGLVGQEMLFRIVSAIRMDKKGYAPKSDERKIILRLLEQFQTLLNDKVSWLICESEGLQATEIASYSAILDCVFAYCLSCLREYSDLISCIASLGIVCLKSKTTENQEFGAKVLVRLLDNVPGSLESLADEDLIKWLTETEFEHDVLIASKPFFESIAKSKKVSCQQLLRLYETGRGYSAAQKSVSYDIIGSFLVKMTSKDRKHFVSHFTDEANELDCALLAGIVKVLASVDLNGVLKRLVDASKSGVSEARNALMTLCETDLSDSVKKGIAEECILLVQQYIYVEFAKDMWERLLAPSKKVAASGFCDDLAWRLVDSIDEKCQSRRLLLEMLADCCEKASSQRIGTVIGVVSKTRDDLLWQFFYRLMEKKIVSCPGVSFSRMVAIAKGTEFENATESYVDLAKACLHLANRNRILDKRMGSPKSEGSIIPEDFEVQCDVGKLEHLDLIQNAFFLSNDEKGSIRAREWLLRIHCQVGGSSGRWATNSMERLVRQQLSGDDTRAKMRAVKLLHEFLNKAESGRDPEDLGRPRHKSIRRGTVELTIAPAGRPRFHMHASTTITAECLAERIATRLQVSQNCVKLQRVIGQNGDYSGIEDFRVSDGDVVEVGIISITSTRRSEMPSIVLSDDGLTAKLLEAVDVDDLDLNREAWKVLCLLQTDKNLKKGMQDMGNFLSELESSSRYRRKYMLQILAKQMTSTELEQFDVCKVFRAMCHVFRRKEGGEHEMLQIMAKFTHIFRLKSKRVVAKIINIVEKTQKDTLALLCLETLNNSLETSMDIVSHAVVERFDAFDRWTASSNEALRNSILVLMNSVSQPRCLFDNCRAKLTSPFYARLCVELVRDLTDELQSDEVLSLFEDMLQASAISEGCSMITGMINKIPGIKAQMSNRVESLLNMAFTDVGGCSQKSIFELVSVIVDGDDDNEAVVTNLLRNVFNQRMERWSYDPEMLARKSKLAGLRNLGATCYVNAIIQQFFHIFPFRYLLMTYAFASDSELRSLQELFKDLMCTRRKFADPADFVNTWHGWSGALLDPHEQQDALEFLQGFLDQIPGDISALFKGTLINQYEGMEHNFVTCSEESFWNISLSVMGFKGLKDSMQDLPKAETVDDYAIENRKISVLKSMKIRDLPAVLIIQLRRFDYDVRAQNRYKIDDVFEFPEQLDMRECVSNDKGEESSDYRLTGMVLHTGTAQHGHYFSYVKKGNTWYKFNDDDVETVPETKVWSDSFGKTERTSAYLLFYEKEGVSFTQPVCLSFDDEFDFTDRLDVSRVCEENQRYQWVQSVFSRETLLFVIERHDIQVLMSYLVNVFCHSVLVEHADKLTEHLKTEIDTLCRASEVIQYCVDNFDEVIKDLSNCVLPQYQPIAETLVNVVTHSLGDTDLSVFFCGKLVKNLGYVAESYLHIPVVVRIVRLFLEQENCCAMVPKSEWIKGMMDFVTQVCAPGRHVHYYEALDLSELFVCLQRLLPLVSDEEMDLTPLTESAKTILTSQTHAAGFLQLVGSVLGQHYAVAVSPLIESMISVGDRSEGLSLMLLASAVRFLRPGGEKELLQWIEELETKGPRVRPRVFIEYLEKACDDQDLEGVTMLATNIIRFTPSVFGRFMVNPAPDVMAAFESLLVGLFPKFTPVIEMPQCKRHRVDQTRYENLVPDLVARIEQFVSDSMMSERRFYRSSMIQQPEMAFKLRNSIRIWHFLSIGGDMMTVERLETVRGKIDAMVSQEIWPDYDVKAFLDFYFDFDVSLLRDSFKELFQTIFERTDSIASSRLLPILDCFLRQFARIDPDTVRQLLVSKQALSLISKLIVDRSANRALSEMVTLMVRGVDSDHVKGELFRILSGDDLWIHENALCQWRICANQKLVAPCDVAVLAKRCLEWPMTGRFLQYSNKVKALNDYIGWIITLSSDDEERNRTGPMEIDWMTIGNRSCGEAVVQKWSLLVEWCCIHNESFQKDFLDHQQMIFTGTGRDRVENHLLRTYIDCSVRMGNSEYIVSLCKTLRASYSIGQYGTRYDSVECRVKSLCDLIDQKCDVNAPWTDPLIDYLIQQPAPLDRETKLHVSLMRKMRPDRLWRLYDGVFRNVATAMDEGRTAGSRLEKIVSLLKEAKPDLVGELDAQMHISPEKSRYHSIQNDGFGATHRYL